MQYSVFERAISKYLLNRNWKKTTDENGIMYVHTNASSSGVAFNSRNFYSFDRIAESIKKVLVKNNLEEYHFNSIINPYPDSDFIIASLQYINKYIYSDEECIKKTIYSFQPVIRTIPKDGSIKNGFLRSFVNVGTVGIDQSMNDYFEQLEIWIDILSACHIHISRISLRAKEKTMAYSGFGLELLVDRREVGQMNYYEIAYRDSIIGITDMGFGLERICWASNSWNCFEAFFQCPQAYFFNCDEVSDLVNFIVLLIFSGVTPGANGYSAILRKTIFELFSTPCSLDYKVLISYAVERTRRFLNDKYSFSEVLGIINKEMDRDICIKLSKEYGMTSKEKTVGDSALYCRKMLEAGIRRP